jgi:hypothetical protein
MHYPNNGFRSYVNLIHEHYSLKPQRWFFVRVLQVFPVLLFRIIKDAGIELLFLTIFWLVISQMSQGRDLVVSLFEPGGLYGGKRIFFISLAVISYSLSMWIIPASLFQEQEDAGAGKNNKPDPFQKHLFFIHRVLPLVPFWLLASAFFRGHGQVFIWTAVAELVILFYINPRLLTDRARLMLMYAILLVIGIFTIIFFINFQKLYTEMKVLYAVNLYLTSAFMFFFYCYRDDKLLLQHAAGPKPGKTIFRRYAGNTMIYFILAAIHVIVLFVIYWLPFRIRISPESMLLYMFSVYVFAIDLVVYFIRVSLLRKLIAATAAIFLLILLSTPAWDIGVSHHTMKANTDSSVLKWRERDSFEDRYLALKQNIMAHEGSDPYPIILISGEGGGSRAGMWFSQNLINFDFETHGRFRNYIFSMSTVSGSSVGLSTVFSFWENTRAANSIEEKWLRLPAEVFANNYVGSSIRGLLMMDLYKSLVPYKWKYNRNNTLQTEEAKTTAGAILDVQGDKKIDRNDIPDSLLTLKKDLMYFFYEMRDNRLQYRENTPITLINTCRSNDGRRGIFSSIKLNERYFNEAIDIAGYLYEDSICTDKGVKQCKCLRKPISLVQACNTSELFPILSAPAYIDSLGSFVDGGYHENSGLKTTLDIYQQLRSRLQSDGAGDTLFNKKSYKIYILYLKNGSGEKQMYRALKSEPSLLQPLYALFNQPFVGSASYFEEKARYIDADGKAVFIPVTLDPNLIMDADKPAEKKKKESGIEKEILKDLTGKIVTRQDGKQEITLNFPLARWLSRTIIRRMQLNSSSIHLNTDIKILLEHIRNSNKLEKVPEGAYERLMSYRKKD